MENLTIVKEVKFLDSIGKWCVGMYCRHYEVWTGGYFDKSLEKAEAAALASLKKSIDYKREIAKKADKTVVCLKY